MTPAIKHAERAKIEFKVHQYNHDPAVQAYGEEAAQAMGTDASRVFKTLVIALNGENKNLAVAVVPVSGQLNLKAAASILGVKKGCCPYKYFSICLAMLYARIGGTAFPT